MGASALQKDRDGLCFFGQISAAISHDLKNVLAIINEDAGLLQDFSLMAAQGMELDPQRLIKLAEKIQGQVKRGDGIIKNMNRFAHSVDLPVCDVDFRELTELVISLLTRIASRKCVTITLKEGEQVNGKGDPFTIQMLMAKALEYSMDSAGRDGELGIEVSSAGGVKAVAISGLSEAISDEQLAELESISVKAGAEPAYVPQDNILTLNF
ncbi:sensor histidine kinase [Maridesulfovibrio sp.]|uniref:sensor histidine kinase n=1 Tax=Maridesulfovibrio sp. TaxID=2795000 RepID=UPI002A186A7C|nr:sensor histidine kinase [Maridesulfovibrio sp.]